jgi:hypothetical protein
LANTFLPAAYGPVGSSPSDGPGGGVDEVGDESLLQPTTIAIERMTTTNVHSLTIGDHAF